MDLIKLCMSSLHAYANGHTRQGREFIKHIAYYLRRDELACDENGDGSRSESRPLPAAMEMGPTNRYKEEVYLNGVLRVHNIRAHLYSSII